jgi:uncharacterized membrane protein HdeD (DUF308 family)
MTAAMKALIVLAGSLIVIVGIVILVAPHRFRDLMTKWEGQARFLFAIIVRIVFGAIVLAVAAELKYRLVMQIIGGISIAAALVILVMGQERMDRFIGWWMRMPDHLLRAWSVAALAFGAFLIYVAV